MRHRVFEARGGGWADQPGPEPMAPDRWAPQSWESPSWSPHPGRPRPGSEPPGTRKRPGRPAGWTRRGPPRSGRSTATRSGTPAARRRDASMTWRPGDLPPLPPGRCRAPGIRPARFRRCRIRATCGASRRLARCPQPRPGPGPDVTRSGARVSLATPRRRAGPGPSRRISGGPGLATRGNGDRLSEQWGLPPGRRGFYYPDNPAACLPDQEEPAAQPGPRGRGRRRRGAPPDSGPGHPGYEGYVDDPRDLDMAPDQGQEPRDFASPGAGTRVRKNPAPGLRATPRAGCCPAWTRDADPGARTAGNPPG